MDVVAEDGSLLEEISIRGQIGQVRKAVERYLSDCQRQVIVLRYGLGGKPPKRQREVDLITDLSRSYISRIEKRALEKLHQERQHKKKLHSSEWSFAVN